MRFETEALRDSCVYGRHINYFFVCMYVYTFKEVFDDDWIVCHVALNRPSYQPSVYAVYHGPHLANDGSKITEFVKQTDATTTTAHCAATQSETNPWWAVDLGVPLSVHEVILTNRRDYCEHPFCVVLLLYL